jgi:FkbM family methyltransferase
MSEMADISSPFGKYFLNRREQQLLRWAQHMPVSWLGRRAALILRKSVLVNGHVIVDAVAEGLKFRLYMRDNVSERKFLFMPQFFDRFERDLLKKRLREGAVFIDIGANAGIYTMTAAACVGETGRVLAIEPNPAVLDRLKFNLTLNGFERRVLVEPSCVSDTEGMVTLTLDDTNLGGSSLVAARSEKTLEVACYPLLMVLKKHGIEKIDALKIDIEGAEDLALAPFLESAPKDLLPRIMIIENSRRQWRRDLEGALKAAGYLLIETTRMNMVWER